MKDDNEEYAFIFEENVSHYVTKHMIQSSRAGVNNTQCIHLNTFHG